MKKFLFILLLQLIFHSSSGQSFSKVYYDSTYDVYGYSVVRTNDGGNIVAGNKDSTGLLFKVDSTGTLLWTKEFGIPGNILFKRIIATKDSSFVICGSVQTNIGPPGLLCMKVTSGGDTVWCRKLNDQYSMDALSITQTYDDGYLLTGSIYTSSFLHKTLIVKLDSLGNQEWNKVIATGSFSNYGYDVKQTADSDFIFMGYASSAFPNGNTYIFKMSPTGSIRWSRNYGLSPGLTMGASILLVPNAVVCLLLRGNDYELMKIDTAGNIEFVKKYINVSAGGCSGCFLPRFQTTYDGGFVFVTGKDPALIGSGGNLIKVDSVGQLEWRQNISMNLADVCENIDHGFTLAGNGPLFGSSGQFRQIGIIRTDSLGNSSSCNDPNSVVVASDSLTASIFSFADTTYGIFTAVFPTMTTININADTGCVAHPIGVEEIIEDNFVVIFPNPARSRINFSFPKPSKLYNLSISNALGQKVFDRSLSKEETRSFSVDVNLTPGLYVVVLRNDEATFTKKLLIE